MAADKYVIPTHLDDPELIGLWTLDEFLAMVIPFVWGILSQHILIGMLLSGAGWWGLRKAKAGRATSWLLHLAYWHLPAGFTGLRATPRLPCLIEVAPNTIDPEPPERITRKLMISIRIDGFLRCPNKKRI